MIEAILAAMLALQPPGASVYSRMVVAEEHGAPCTEDTILCEPPTWSTHHNDWTIAETYDAGLERYRIIAEAVADVVFDPYREFEWSTPNDAMWRYMIAIMFHESGFRADVHSGIGARARGDCQTKHGVRFCHSWCLGQILLGKRKLAKTGWSGEDIIGTDIDSTRRCVATIADYVDRSYRVCSRQLLHRSSCVFAVYGGMGPASNDRRIISRVKTYESTRATR
jgi:hypothetical protein